MSLFFTYISKSEEPLLVPQRTKLKRAVVSSCEEHMNTCSKEPYFVHYEELYCDVKMAWMLKVLCGTPDANKEPLF